MAHVESLPKNLPSLWRILRHFWPQVRKHRLLIVGSWTALLAEVGLRLLEPWPLKVLFDTLFARERRVYRVSLFDIFEPTTLVTMAAGAIVAVTALRALAAYWNTIGFAKLGNRVLTQVRTQLYRHVQYLSLSFHTAARTGDLVVRVISDVGMLQDVVVTALLPMLAKLFILAGMMALMFYINWQLSLIALAVFPLFWLRTITIGRRIREVARKQRQREGLMAATAAESIGAIKTVQALSLESSFEKVFASQNEKNLKQDIKGKRLAASLERSVDVLTAVAGALVLWYGARLVMLKELTPGDLLVFLAYLKNSFRPIQDFAKYTGRLGKATAAGERILDLLERVPDVRDLPHAIKATVLRGEVRFESVTFAYERGQRVLQGIDLRVMPGQSVALVGPSGGGKTTLVGLILRLYDPSEGRVLLDGQDIREFTLESLRAQISVVLQDNLLFAASVRDNIACGAPAATMEEVEAAARLANAHDFIQALPQGYDTILGERGVTVSQGQRQRIAIARAAIRNAPILILDEPTTALDTQNEEAVLEALARLNHDRTTFLITHNLQQAAHADLILYLEAGQILECGSHEELLRANGRYAAMRRFQSEAGHRERVHEQMTP
jgi:ATP-binding cassette subfamily B protein